MSDPFRDVDLPTRRRDARERAVSLLYEAEMKSLSVAEVIELLPVPLEELVELLTMGVDEHHDDLDRYVADSLDASWTLARLAVLDRIILRLASFELAHRPDVPTGAIINEAVELAKEFSGPEAGSFVNGVLSSVAAELR